MSQRDEIDRLIAAAEPCPRRELSAKDDSPRLRELADYHRVSPLLLQRLGQHEQLSAIAIRNLYLASELIRLVKAFSAAGIPVLPHKGVLLGQAAYGDLALRESLDLDLLIHPEDLPRAIALLAENGYRPPPKLAWLPPSALARWAAELPYESPKSTLVDLHWRLTPSHYPLQLNPGILWRSQTRIAIAGSSLPALAPEALLLLLAVHGTKHCWECLVWVADIAWLLHSNPALKWDQALDFGQETQCERAVLLAGWLAHNVFAVDLPEQVKQLINRDYAVQLLGKRVVMRWYDSPPETPASPELYGFARALARRRRDAWKHLAGVLFAPTEIDWETRKLPEKLFWMYSFLRIGRLARKYRTGSNKS